MIPYLTNNQPYLNLESEVDLAGVQSIELDIALGLTKSRHLITDGTTSYESSYKNEFQTNKKNLMDETCPEKLKDLNNKFYEYYKQLDFDRADCRMFTKYAGEYLQLGQILNLRHANGPDPYKDKGRADLCCDTEAYQHFPSLKDWINNQKIFTEIGRIVFFLNGPGEEPLIHWDRYSGKREHFILINLHPGIRKKSFLLDDAGNKVFIDSKVYTFDTRNYHGTTGLGFPSWTLRIDGQFESSWAKRVWLGN